jgi:hypothetical protein
LDGSSVVVEVRGTLYEDTTGVKEDHDCPGSDAVEGNVVSGRMVFTKGGREEVDQSMDGASRWRKQ